MFKKIAALAGALLLSTSAVQAADYKVEFTLSSFGAVAPGMETAPFSNAFGSVIFSAPTLNSDWDKLKAFSLTIGDVSYTMAETELVNYYYGVSMGGLVNSSPITLSETNDFFLLFYPGEQRASLNYSSVAAPGYWYGETQDVRFTELAVSAVPEAETYVMLLAGLGMLGALARRRRSTSTR